MVRARLVAGESGGQAAHVDVALAGPFELKVTFGRYLRASSKVVTFNWPSCSPVIAWMVMGTSWIGFVAALRGDRHFGNSFGITGIGRWGGGVRGSGAQGGGAQNGGDSPG